MSATTQFEAPATAVVSLGPSPSAPILHKIKADSIGGRRPNRMPATAASQRWRRASHWPVCSDRLSTNGARHGVPISCQNVQQSVRRWSRESLLRFSISHLVGLHPVR